MRTKRTIALVLSFVMVLSLTSFVHLNADEALYGEHSLVLPVCEVYLSEEFFANHDAALLLHHDIFNSLPQRRDGSFVFPDYYGGHFIGDDGNLVVNIVSTRDRSVCIYDSYVLGDVIANPSVNIQYVEFTYAELNDMMVFLLEHWLSDPYSRVSIAAPFNKLCVINNHIVVGIIDDYYSEEMKATFRRYVVDSPMIIFEAITRQTEEIQPIELDSNMPNCDAESSLYEYIDIEPSNISLTLRPGDRIYIGNPTINLVPLPLSIGYGVQRGAQRGFVTTPHNWQDPFGQTVANMRVYDRAGAGRNLIGFATNPIAFHNHGGANGIGADAVMVVFSGAHTLQNTINGRTIFRGFNPPVVGQLVTAIGAVTGLHIDRPIASINATNSGLGRLVQVNNLPTRGGDSGGAVVNTAPGLPHNGVLALGMIHGGGPTPTSTLVTRADAVNAILGVSIP